MPKSQPAQLELEFDPPVLKHPGRINVGAYMLRRARKAWGTYEDRDRGRNRHTTVWWCACGESMVGIVGGWR